MKRGQAKQSMIIILYIYPNSNKNTISSQCPAYGLSNELTNPNEPNEVFELSINEYLKKINEFYVKYKMCKLL